MAINNAPRRMDEQPVQAAIVPLSLTLLAKLLQLPEGAHIDCWHFDPSQFDVALLRVRGAGWTILPTQVIPQTSARVTEYRDDDGRCFKRVIEWDMPSNEQVKRPGAAQP